jgi:hypothetical protein
MVSRGQQRDHSQYFLLNTRHLFCKLNTRVQGEGSCSCFGSCLLSQVSVIFLLHQKGQYPTTRPQSRSDRPGRWVRISLNTSPPLPTLSAPPSALFYLSPDHCHSPLKTQPMSYWLLSAAGPIELSASKDLSFSGHLLFISPTGCLPDARGSSDTRDSTQNPGPQDPHRL